MKSRNRPLSSHALSVLQAITNARQEWSYGLEISKVTGLKSGSLYPILMRLDDRGLLESCWLEPERPGRPPRHGYRITKAGLAALTEAEARPVKSNLREKLV
jgi:PadR family transcriptional regulator, regulatory protein PadR